MKITLNVFPLLISVVFFSLAWATLTEKIDQYITFAGEANALFFFIMSASIGGMSLIAAFEKNSKKSS